MFQIASVKIVAALFIMLIGSALSEDTKFRICSCRIVSCLESRELIKTQSALWYSLTLMGGSIGLLRFVEKLELIAEWSSLFKVRFWILFKKAGGEIILGRFFWGVQGIPHLFSAFFFFFYVHICALKQTELTII